MKPTGAPPSLHPFLASVLIFILVLGACSALPQPEVTATVPEPTQAQKPLLVELEFETTLPEPVPEDQVFTLELLDEVTGLALNPQRYAMTAENPTTYSLKLSVSVGSVLKYRYIQEGKQTAIEYNSIGKQVRYRLYNAISPGKIHDAVLAWNTLPYQGSYGRIQGRVTSAKTGAPIPASMVTVGGQDTLTASDGTFLVDKLPPGVHVLVVYSLDGSHQVFQQQAQVAAESSTPAEIQVTPSELVKVTFMVDPPDGNPPGIPIRLIGNIASLGNSFSDLRGGVSGIASRAPLLKYTDSGKYTLELELPSGLDLRYKYTLGDGFWNAERTSKSGFQLRQLIVPSQSVTIEDKIETWQTVDKAPVTFKVTVPATTPAGDTVSIQFNPYGWTEPIPMWPLGENRWLYVLYNPLDLIGEAAFRYCRNEQCNIADDIKTKGPDAAGNKFKPEEYSQVIDETVTEWNWSLPAVDPITVPSGDIPAKPQGFMTAIELSADYHPSWQPYFGQAFQNISSLRSDWVILSPTWHYTSTNPPVVNIVPGVDPSWYDLSQTINAARAQGLHIALHPTSSFYQPQLTWWAEAARDNNWWQSWYDRYETFVLHHADLATQSGAEVLILGDENILPALPGGQIAGNPSGAPDYAETRWREIISKVRSRFSGKLGWYIVYPDGYANIPPFLNDVDQLYLVMSGKLNDTESPASADLTAAAAKIIEGDFLSLRDRFNRPVLLGIAYPSAKGAATGCIRSSDACLPSMVFAQGGLDIPSVEIDVRGQAEIYNSILQAVSNNTWLSGVFSVGFYPPVKIADQSLSIYGKPASDVTWFWFDHFVPAPR